MWLIPGYFQFQIAPAWYLFIPFTSMIRILWTPIFIPLPEVARRFKLKYHWGNATAGALPTSRPGPQFSASIPQLL
jgi:hypothetical protein